MKSKSGRLLSHFQNSTKECGFSNAENLARLHKSLRGKVKDAVQAFLKVPDNVPDVIRSLERRFGQSDTIVQSLTAASNRRRTSGTFGRFGEHGKEYGGDHEASERYWALFQPTFAEGFGAEVTIQPPSPVGRAL